MGRESEEKIVPLIRPSAYVIGIVSVVIWQIVGTFLTGFTPGQTLIPWPKTEPWMNPIYRMGQTVIIQWALLWPFIFGIVASILRKATINLTKQELAVISSMLWVTFLIPSYYGVTPMYTYWAGALTDAIYGPFAKRILPGLTYFAPDPKNEAVWKAFWWRGPVDWAAWMPAIIFNTVFIYTYYLTFLMVATLLRKVMVDVEALPFPWATAGAEIINISTSISPEKPRLFKNKFIWAGLGLGLVSTANYWLPSITAVPWIPNPIGYDLSPLAIPQFPYVPLQFDFDPWIIGAAFLIPREWLLSYIAWGFILNWIAPIVMSGAGLIGTQPVGMVGYACYTRHTLYGTSVWNTGPGLFFGTGTWATIAGGVSLSIWLWPLLTVDREYLGHAIKSLWKKPPLGEEKDEPMQYRYVMLFLILLIVAYAGIVQFASQGNAPFWWGIIFMGWMIFFHAFPRARFESTLGAGGGVGGHSPGEYYLSTYGLWWACDPASPICPGKITGLEDPLTVNRALITYWTFPMGSYPFVATAAPISTGLDAYKMGRLTETPSKKIFTGMLIAILIAVPLAGVVFLNWVHIYGGLDKFAAISLKDWPVRRSYNSALGAANNWWIWYSQNSNGVCSYGYHIGEAIGLVVGIALWIFIARVPWLPLHPIGFAAQLWVTPVAWLTPAVIAYLIKTVVLRMGGVSLYERKGLPLAIGLVIAFSITLLFCGFVEAYKITTK